MTTMWSFLNDNYKIKRKFMYIQFKFKNKKWTTPNFNISHIYESDMCYVHVIMFSLVNTEELKIVNIFNITDRIV